MAKRKSDASVFSHILFLGPASAVFAVIVIIPFIGSVAYSLTNWDGVSPTAAFVGLRNFTTILAARSDFVSSFFFTIKLTLANVVLVTTIGTALAVALSSSMKFEGAFRALFYLPQTLGGLILGFIWQFIFISGFPAVGGALHIPFFSQQWLGTESTAYAALVIVSVWQGVGYVMVIMIAALSSISRDVLESARIDGAGAAATFFRVKLPICMPYVTVSLFWTTASALKMFELIVSLTKGGPYGSTVTLALNVYNDAFARNKYGLATAESFLFFLIILAITSLQMRFTRRKEADYT